MKKARGEPTAPFISGAAWNLPSPRVPPLGQRCWLTPINGEQRGVIPALPAWPYKAQHGLQPWQHPSLPSAPSCCPAPEAGHQPASRHHLSTVQEVWWDGPPASPTDESHVPPKLTVPNSSPLELSKNIAWRLDFSLLALKKLWNTVRSHPTHIWSLFLHFPQFCFFSPLFTF